MVAGTRGYSVAEKSTVLLVAPALLSLPCEMSASPVASLGLCSLICEMREIVMSLWCLPALRLIEVGYIKSFSEILRKIILLQKTLQDK